IFALRRIAGSTHSAGGVRDHRRAGCNDPRPDEGRECEQDGSGITPRVGDDVRRTDLVAQQRAIPASWQLRHSIDRVAAAVTWPEITGEIDHARTGLAGARHPGERRAVWERAEYQGSTVEGDVIRPLKGDRTTGHTDGLPALFV